MCCAPRLLLGTVGVLVWLIGPTMPIPGGPGGAPVAAPSTITLHGADPGWIAGIEADMSAFVRAGLGAPVVDVHVWDRDRTEQCRGYAGLFAPTGDRLRVDLCVDFHDTDLGANLRHKLVLHELAHAWVHANVDDPTRKAFMNLRGAEAWNDPEISHYARGTELAANVVMNLLHPEGPSNEQHGCGYELLTGQPVPTGRHDPCPVWSRREVT